MISLITAIIIEGVVLYIQEKSPLVTVKCQPYQGIAPDRIECAVQNTGRAEARDIRVSFNGSLPLQTQVYSRPEIGVTLEESPFLPKPRADPQWAKTQMAFSIKLPRIVPGDTVLFQVMTTDPDNRKAAKQILCIREVLFDTLKTFGERLAQVDPEEAKKWDFGQLTSAYIKYQNLFTPAFFHYEGGRWPVEYLTVEERAAEAASNDAARKYTNEINTIVNGKRSEHLPVIRVKAQPSNDVYVLNFPHVNSHFNYEPITITPEVQAMWARGEIPIYTVQVPASYGGTCGEK